MTYKLDVVSDNCVDRHAEEHPDRVAIIWERDEPGDTQCITYRSAVYNLLSVETKIHQKHIPPPFTLDNCWRVRVVLLMCSRGRE